MVRKIFLNLAKIFLTGLKIITTLLGGGGGGTDGIDKVDNGGSPMQVISILLIQSQLSRMIKKNQFSPLAKFFNKPPILCFINTHTHIQAKCHSLKGDLFSSFCFFNISNVRTKDLERISTECQRLKIANRKQFSHQMFDGSRSADSWNMAFAAKHIWAMLFFFIAVLCTLVEFHRRSNIYLSILYRNFIYDRALHC